MKILVISEKFDNGGLETQIKTYYESLPSDVEMVFAFGIYTEKIKLNNAKIYNNFHFSYTDTIENFCDDVDRLVEIINKENIDVIHVHPYYSFFAAYFASQITKVKIFYSYHGISSYNFLKTPISQAIFQYAFESKGIACILSVSEDGINCFQNLNNTKTVLLHNPIDLKQFPKAQLDNNNSGHWALISRIDKDKIKEIKKIIEEINSFKITKLDIYGNGTEIENLKKFINEKKLNKNIFCRGYSNNIFKTTNNKYCGVIGIGRSALEALAMGYPTILIGYNKVSGFINLDVFNKIKNNNFSNIHLNEENYNFPSLSEINQISLEIRQNYNSEVIIKKYLQIIKSNTSLYKENISNLYLEIKKLSKDISLKKCSFQKERLIYNLIYEYIGKYTLDPKTYNLFVNANLSYELFDILLARIIEMKGKINNDKN